MLTQQLALLLALSALQQISAQTGGYYYPTRRRRLSRGGIGGIIASAVVFAILLGLMLMLAMRRRRQARKLMLGGPLASRGSVDVEKNRPSHIGSNMHQQPINGALHGNNTFGNQNAFPQPSVPPSTYQPPSGAPPVSNYQAPPGAPPRY